MAPSSLAELGKNIDAAADALDVDRLSELTAVSQNMAASASDDERVDLHYFAANALGAISHIKQRDDPDYAWSWRQEEAINEVLALRTAINEPSFQHKDIVRRCQIRTNLGNRLNSLGRCIEAIEQWNEVLATIPHFAMALGNKAHCLVYYSRELYDDGHQLVLLDAALKGFNAALAGDAFWDSGPHPRAEAQFRERAGEVERYLEWAGYEATPDPNAWSLGKSKAERLYRKWCLSEGLFLNPLNDALSDSIAAADVFHLPSHTYKVGERARFPAYFNLLKQEYVSARYRLYDAMNERERHFSDNDVLLFETFDGAILRYKTEQLKAAYRTTYGLFDKIALFLNDYFSVGMRPDDVSLRKIWTEKVKGSPTYTLRQPFQDSRNWPLRGLYFLSKDLFDTAFVESAEPDAARLAALRHAAEHRFLTLQEYDAREPSDETLSYITEEDFEAKTLRLLKMARAALIYLSLAMCREEEIRREKEDGEEVKLIASVAGIPRNTRPRRHR